MWVNSYWVILFSSGRIIGLDMGRKPFIHAETQSSTGQLVSINCTNPRFDICSYVPSETCFEHVISSSFCAQLGERRLSLRSCSWTSPHAVCRHLRLKLQRLFFQTALTVSHRAMFSGRWVPLWAAWWRSDSYLCPHKPHFPAVKHDHTAHRAATITTLVNRQSFSSGAAASSGHPSQLHGAFDPICEWCMLMNVSGSDPPDRSVYCRNVTANIFNCSNTVFLLSCLSSVRPHSLQLSNYLSPLLTCFTAIDYLVQFGKSSNTGGRLSHSISFVSLSVFF